MMSSGLVHRIERAEMNKYPGAVTDLVLHLVNEQAIRYKWVDGDHLALYPPDGVGRPFKISPKRPAESQIEYIEKQFMRRNDIPGPDGAVPYAKGQAVDDADLSGREPSTETLEGAQIAPLVPGATEALRALADTLGVTIGGGVSEDDFLAVVAEKDQCAADRERLTAQVEELEAEVEQRQITVDAITAQRDELLGKVDAAKAALGCTS